MLSPLVSLTCAPLSRPLTASPRRGDEKWGVEPVFEQTQVGGEIDPVLESVQNIVFGEDIAQDPIDRPLVLDQALGCDRIDHAHVAIVVRRPVEPSQVIGVQNVYGRRVRNSEEQGAERPADFIFPIKIRPRDR